MKISPFEITRMLSDYGLRVESIRRNKHIVVVVKNDKDVTSKLVMALTPSDRNACRQIQRDMQRAAMRGRGG